MECKDTIALQIVGKYISNRYSGPLSFDNSVSMNLKAGVPKTCSDPDKVKDILLKTSFDFSEKSIGTGVEFDYSKTLLEAVSKVDERFINQIPFFYWLYFKEAESPIPFDSSVNKSQLPAEISGGGRLTGSELFLSTVSPMLYAIGIGRIDCSYDDSLIGTLNEYQSYIFADIKNLLGPKMSEKLQSKISELSTDYPEFVCIEDIKEKYKALSQALDSVVSKTIITKVTDSAKQKLHAKIRSDIEFLEK